METLMSLQQYVLQVRPRNESYIPPVEKLQNFLAESSTADATNAGLYRDGPLSKAEE